MTSINCLVSVFLGTKINFRRRLTCWKKYKAVQIDKSADLKRQAKIGLVVLFSENRLEMGLW